MKVLLINRQRNPLGTSKKSKDISQNSVNTYFTSNLVKGDTLVPSTIAKAYRGIGKTIHSILSSLNPDVRHFYDKNNRLIRIDNYNFKKIPIYSGEEHSFLLQKHFQNGKFNNEKLFDSNNKLREEHFYNANDAQNAKKSIYYNENGVIVKRIDNDEHFK